MSTPLIPARFRYRHVECQNDECAKKPGRVLVWETELFPGVYTPSNFTCRTCNGPMNAVDDLGDTAPSLLGGKL